MQSSVKQLLNISNRDVKENVCWLQDHIKKKLHFMCLSRVHGDEKLNLISNLVRSFDTSL